MTQNDDTQPSVSSSLLNSEESEQSRLDKWLTLHAEDKILCAAIKEACVSPTMSEAEYQQTCEKAAEHWYTRVTGPVKNGKSGNKRGGFGPPTGRNRRSVWKHDDETSLASWIAKNKPDVFAEFCQQSGRRSFWNIASAPFAEAHFATYPPELIRPMIRAGTSERGCCPACLAPWERVTERTKIKRERPNDFVKRTGETGTGNSCGNTVAGVSTKTIGWRPTCKCDAGKPIPCTIIDPFGGSGTSGMVARQEGRRCVMIELNREYAKLHRRRVEERLPAQSDDDAPLLALAE